jgi:alanine racemase
MLYQTYARIHLDNIAFNLAGIRQAVGPQRKILIAVKANAYGHGAVEVARLAERSGVDWLGVATVPEGLQLRLGGIGLPILKFSPAFPEEMEAAVTNGLALAACERGYVDALDLLCRAASLQAAVHLKVETGMGRIGVPVAEAPPWRRTSNATAPACAWRASSPTCRSATTPTRPTPATRSNALNLPWTPSTRPPAAG